MKALEATAALQFFTDVGLNKTYWLAYSGGLDSHALLHLCVQARTLSVFDLRVIHVHHGLSQYADDWAAHCRQVCAEYGVEYHQQNIDAKSTVGKSPEEVARQRRYEVFSQCLQPGDVLLTAHHEDDQAETVLLQLLRGAGVKGLAAMPMTKPLGQGMHARPLLACTRAELQKYAEQHQLRWVEDESNQNVGLTRNFLRHEVLPLLKKRWPTVTHALSRSASHCAEALPLLETAGNEVLQQSLGSRAGTLSVQKLLLLDPIHQRLALRAWLHAQACPMPDTVKLQQLQHDMLTASRDSEPCLAWQDVEVRRYRDDLYVMPTLPLHDVMQTWVWDLQSPLMIPGVGCLQADRKKGQGLRADISSVVVKFRQGGEKCHLPKRSGHHDLKKLFQEWGVPSWQRKRIPLLYLGEKCIAVVGFFIDEDYMAKEGEEGVEVNIIMKRLNI